MAARYGNILKITILFSVMVSLLAVAVEAKPKKKKARSTQRTERRLIMDVGLSISYDDNIINYSDSDIDVFESDTLAGKFSIKSKDDWIITPRISPRLTGRFIGDQLGWVDLAFSYYAYASNDIRSYGRFSLGVRQYLSPKFYGEISYVYIPDYYYRNYQVGTDDSGAGIFAEAKFTKHIVTVETGYEFTKTFSGTAAYIFQHKSFNSEFEFRNLDGDGLELGVIWKPIKPFRFWGTYGLERASAKGADMAYSIPDVSYDSWSFTFGVRHYMSVLPGFSPEPYGSVQIKDTKYQTDRFWQFYYYRREDMNYIAKAGISLNLPYRLGGAFEYAFAQKKAQLPDIYPDPGRVSQTTSELEQTLNYKSNSITFRVNRRF
jgi:hypothetical protein